MISQILGYSTLFILVFGGIIGAIIKFTLSGSAQVNVNHRIPEEKIDDVLEQIGVKQEKEKEKEKEKTSSQSHEKSRSDENEEQKLYRAS